MIVLLCHLSECDILEVIQKLCLESQYLSATGVNSFLMLEKNSIVVDAIERIRVIIYNYKSCSCSRVKLM